MLELYNDKLLDLFSKSSQHDVSSHLMFQYQVCFVLFFFKFRELL